VTIKQLEQLETELGVCLTYKARTKTIAVKGKADAVEEALKRIAPDRDRVAALLCERQGLLDEAGAIVEREVSYRVPPLATQRQAYIQWFKRCRKFIIELKLSLTQCSPCYRRAMLFVLTLRSRSQCEKPMARSLLSIRPRALIDIRDDR
jgi:hypothetical protein